MRTLKANERKVTLAQTFIDNIFELESGKASENDETSPFRDQFSWQVPVAFRT